MYACLPHTAVPSGFGVRELNDFHYESALTVSIPPIDPSAQASIK